MIKTFIKLLFVSTIVLSLSANAQPGSPYSQYGIGDLKNSGFGQSQALGGTGVALRSNSNLNLVNPAAISKLDSMQVIYELGISGAFNNLSAGSARTTLTSTSIDYAAFGFQAMRFWDMGVSIQKASDVDYAFRSIENHNYIGEVENYYYGKGSIYKASLTNAFTLFKGFSIGLSASYCFGSIQTMRASIFANTSFDHSKYDETNYIEGFTFKGGFQYDIQITKEWGVVVGATYDYGSSLRSTSTVLAGIIEEPRNSSDNQYRIADVIGGRVVDTSLFNEEVTSRFNLPTTIAGGISIRKSDQLLIAFDYTNQNFKDFNFNDKFIEKKNPMSIRGGIQFTPDKNSVTDYLKRVDYRIGGHYAQSYFNVQSADVFDYGISFGVGLPMRNSKTGFNLSFELGQRGGDSEILVKETYGIVSLNLSLSDIWFVKRKYK